LLTLDNGNKHNKGKHVYADKLAEICKYYGFDGYLINIEAKYFNSIFNLNHKSCQCFRTRRLDQISHKSHAWKGSWIYCDVLWQCHKIRDCSVAINAEWWK